MSDRDIQALRANQAPGAANVRLQEETSGAVRRIEGAAALHGLRGQAESESTQSVSSNVTNIVNLFGVPSGCDFKQSVNSSYNKQEALLNKALAQTRSINPTSDQGARSQAARIRELENSLTNLKTLRNYLIDIAPKRELYEVGREQQGQETRTEGTDAQGNFTVTVNTPPRTTNNSWQRRQGTACTARKKTISQAESETKEEKKKEVVTLGTIETDIFEELFASKILKPAKYIKCYTMFNSKTPTPFIKATAHFPTNFGVHDEKSVANIDINQYVIQRYLDNPPYNQITGFNYDVFARAVELDIKDTSDTLGEFFLTQLSSIEKVNSGLTIFIRYGWSAPYITRQNAKFIEDPDNYEPVKFRTFRIDKQRVKILSSRARMYNIVSFNVNEIDISKEAASTTYKIKGTDNDYSSVNPYMSKWMPLNNPSLGNLPLGQLATSRNLMQIIGELKRDVLDFVEPNFENIQDSTIKYDVINPKPKRLNSRDTEIYNNSIRDKMEANLKTSTKAATFAALLLKFLNAIEKEASVDATNVNSTVDLKKSSNKNIIDQVARDSNYLSNLMLANTDKEAMIKAFEKQSELVYGLRVTDAIKKEADTFFKTNEFKTNEQKNTKELWALLISLAKKTKIDVVDALTYVISEARKHMHYINQKGGLQRNKMEFIALNFSQFDKWATPNDDDTSYIKSIPVNAITADISTNYKKVIENIASLIKVKAKTIGNKETYLDLNVGWFHAKNKLEIEELVYSLALRRMESIENFKTTSQSASAREENNRFETYLENMFFIFSEQLKPMMKDPYKLDIKKPESIKGNLSANIKEEYDHLIVCVFSEYTMEGFTEVIGGIESNEILQGYCFRPQGFRTTESDYTFAQENQQINKSSTRFSTGVNTNYFNSGTMNVFDNNYPDLLTFSPKINFGQLQAAANSMKKKDPMECFSMIMEQRTTREETAKSIREENSRLSVLTEAQITAEKLRAKETGNVNVPLIDGELFADLLGETEYEKFPTALFTIPYSDSPRAMLNNKFHRAIFKNRLAAFMVAYEADITIMGEPYLDQHSLNKYLYIKCLTEEGNDTFYTGIYQITGLVHNISGGNFKTEVKLLRTKAAVNPVAQRLQGFMEAYTVKEARQE